MSIKHMPRHAAKFVTIITKGNQSSRVSLDFGDFDSCKHFAELMRLGWRWDPNQ
jgi:hypothetical protein